MLIMVGNNKGNVLFIAFGALIILSFLSVAFVLLARQAENLAVFGRDRISTNFAAYSGLQYTITQLREELLKQGQFTKNSKLFFKGEDPEWNFEFNEENDVNKNGLLDTFNLPVEVAKNVSIEKSVVSEGEKNVFFRVKVVDESSKFPVNDDIKLTTRILENLSACLNMELDIKKFLDLRNGGEILDQKTFIEAFGEKNGNFLLQFFTFTPKLFSKTLYYVDSVRYDGEKIYSITQIIPKKEKIRIGLKPLLNINTASKPVICADFINLSAFYLKIEKYKRRESFEKVMTRNLNKNIGNLWPIGIMKYVSLERSDFERFYTNFLNSTKKKLYKTYREFFDFMFSKSDLEKIKAELIWTNANPNIDILKFNDIWNYMYVKDDVPKFVNREIDKLDLILPTYEIAFNSSGLFSIEVEGRYQYKNIILARHKLNASVDLMDYIIDTTQEDFLAGNIEKTENTTKNNLSLITYPEYDLKQAKSNRIDGQLGLSFNVGNDNSTCSLKLNDLLMLRTKSNHNFKVKDKFSSYIDKYGSVFDIRDTNAVVPSGLIVDGVKTLELPLDFCMDKFKAGYAELPKNDIFPINNKKEYDAFHLGLSMWIKPSYYSSFVFPLISTYSEERKQVFAIFKLKNDDVFWVLTKEFKVPLAPLGSKKFFGCLDNYSNEMAFSPNRWFHFALDVELKSCALYYNNLPNKKDMSNNEMLQWFLGRCPYYTIYIDGKQVDYVLQDKDITIGQFFDSQDLSEFNKFFIGDSGETNSFFTIDNVSFFKRFELLKNELNTVNAGRYYNRDTVFTSREFFNKEDYLYLLASEVFTLPTEYKYDNMLCIKFRDVTGATQCYGNLLDTPFARWNVSFVGRTFSYMIVWKNLSFCGNNTSPIVDSVILTMFKKPTIKFLFEDAK